MLAELEQAARSEAAPYVGGGLGVAALVYAVERITAAVLQLRAVAGKHLEAWGRHRKAEAQHWRESRRMLEHLVEERQKRDAEAAAARRYLTEQRAITDRHDAIEHRLDALEQRLAVRAEGASLGS